MILLDGSTLTIEHLLAIADRGEPVMHIEGADAARACVRASRLVIDRRARGDEPAYGINTGFGSFAEVKIAPDALEALQLNLLRSHAAGLGDPLPARAVRATMALRANVLAKGFSGISDETLDALIALLNQRVHPRVPSRGSVGASGDLAPLAHLALVLIGEGEVLATFAHLKGVSPADQPAFYAFSKTHFAEIFAGDEVTEIDVIGSLDRLLSSDAQLAAYAKS